MEVVDVEIVDRYWTLLIIIINKLLLNAQNKCRYAHSKKRKSAGLEQEKKQKSRILPLITNCSARRNCWQIKSANNAA